jgi:type I restriction enzyme S subunit
MSNFPMDILGNVSELLDCLHKTPTYVEKGIPMVRVTDVKKGYLNLDGALKISENDYQLFSKGYTPKNGDIVFTRVGSYGISSLVNNNQNFCLGQNTVLIKPKNINGKYLFYWLCSSECSSEIESLVGGSTQPTISMASIRKIEVPIPPLQEQKAIAEVLSSLDDKIDLLHRNNKTLEEMAETLFRQWFVELVNVPETRIMKIEDVAEMQNGYSFKSSEFVEGGVDTIEVMKMGHISPNGGLRTTPKKDFVKRSEKLNKWKLNKRDIVLCMTDMKDNVVVLGVPALVDQDDKYVLNQRVGRIFLKPNSCLSDILILFMQMRDKVFIGELQSKANSGVQVNLGTETIRESQIIVPDLEQQKSIIPKLQSLFDKLDLNREQVLRLEKLRDTLLPKLMSGQVRVKL